MAWHGMAWHGIGRAAWTRAWVRARSWASMREHGSMDRMAWRSCPQHGFAQVHNLLTDWEPICEGGGRGGGFLFSPPSPTMEPGSLLAWICHVSRSHAVGEQPAAVSRACAKATKSARRKAGPSRR